MWLKNFQRIFHFENCLRPETLIFLHIPWQTLHSICTKRHLTDMSRLTMNTDPSNDVRIANFVFHSQEIYNLLEDTKGCLIISLWYLLKSLILVFTNFPISSILLTELTVSNLLHSLSSSSWLLKLNIFKLSIFRLFFILTQ